MLKSVYKKSIQRYPGLDPRPYLIYGLHLCIVHVHFNKILVGLNNNWMAIEFILEVMVFYKGKSSHV